MELRIETRMYAGDEPDVISSSTTLFAGDVVYDFREDEGRVTIFRAGHAGAPGRFVLLDTARRVRTEIDTDRLTGAMEKLRQWAATQKDPFLRFTAEPHFEETFDRETGVLTMTSPHLTYRITTEPAKDASAEPQIKQFLDWFVQLHTLLEAGLPPGPRLEVNEALMRHSAIALEVQLAQHRDDETSLRAEHLVTWLLSKQDRNRIDESLDKMAEFREVSNVEFQTARQALR
ncbi:hypothetical protein [Pirellulimonas nuda]|uniref:hypothetical protein n=1 Tax=Pirellulimonas nuda TaxID=2528009 RepID=UPI001E442AF1|nr:hypothetical protein [Pirellulimonas nuda]